MGVTYTNRKGVTYHLCRGQTKTGKARYYFARQPQGEPVDEVPPGYSISESPNGVVSLVRDRPAQILSHELLKVEEAIRAHPRGSRYRASVKNDRIEIYERSGPDAAELVAAFRPFGFTPQGMIDELEADRERRARYALVLRFIIADAERRVFRAERMCYLGSIDDWIDVFRSGPIDELAPALVPTLGTDEFFELL